MIFYDSTHAAPHNHCQYASRFFTSSVFLPGQPVGCRIRCGLKSRPSDSLKHWHRIHLKRGSIKRTPTQRASESPTCCFQRQRHSSGGRTSCAVLALSPLSAIISAATPSTFQETLELHDSFGMAHVPGVYKYIYIYITYITYIYIYMILYTYRISL